jgi:hypothetical protein
VSGLSCRDQNRCDAANEWQILESINTNGMSQQQLTLCAHLDRKPDCFDGLSEP